MHKMLTKNPNLVNIKVKKKKKLLENSHIKKKEAGFDRFGIKIFWHELRFKKMVECSLPQSNVLYLHVTLCIGYVFILIIIC